MFFTEFPIYMLLGFHSLEFANFSGQACAAVLCTRTQFVEPIPQNTRSDGGSASAESFAIAPRCRGLRFGLRAPPCLILRVYQP